MKTILTLILLALCYAHTAQSSTLLKPNMILEKDREKTTCLVEVQKDNNHYYFGQNGEKDINITYRIKKVYHNGLHVSYNTIAVQFLPDVAGRYRIMEKETNNSWIERRSILDAFRSMRTTPAEEWEFTGYSNDATHYAVMALKYLNKHNSMPKFYEPGQVDKRPMALNTDSKNLAKYIEECIKRDMDISSKAVFRLKYIVDETGKTSIVDIDYADMNNPDAAKICKAIYNSLFNIEWNPAKLENIPVAVRQSITISFNLSD